MSEFIKFNIPYYGEEDNIQKFLAINQDYKSLSVKKLKEVTNADEVLLTSGATSAMDAFFAGVDFPKGSEVIMPSFTFPSAANVVLRAGLKPIFAEVDIKTLVMDLDDVIKKITSNTSCVMPVHYGGASMDMDELSLAIKDKNICIFEDSALAYGGLYKNKHLGTIGSAGVISFHSTKNLSADGGGAFLINNSDYVEMFKNILANGTDKQAFLRGEVAEYTWQRVGAGAEMSGLTAALLYSQLEKGEQILSKRGNLWDRYLSRLKSTKIEDFASLPVIPEYNTNNYHVFYLIFKHASMRERVRLALNSQGIQAYIHYKPLHSSVMGKKLGYKETDLQITQRASDCILRLPMHMHLSIADVDYVCDKLLQVVKDA